jgi:hypothetical protein
VGRFIIFEFSEIAREIRRWEADSVKQTAEEIQLREYCSRRSYHAIVFYGQYSRPHTLCRMCDPLDSLLTCRFAHSSFLDVQHDRRAPVAATFVTSFLLLHIVIREIQRLVVWSATWGISRCSRSIVWDSSGNIRPSAAGTPTCGRRMGMSAGWRRRRFDCEKYIDAWKSRSDKVCDPANGLLRSGCGVRARGWRGYRDMLPALLPMCNPERKVSRKIIDN